MLQRDPDEGEGSDEPPAFDPQEALADELKLQDALIGVSDAQAAAPMVTTSTAAYR